MKDIQIASVTSTRRPADIIASLVRDQPGYKHRVELDPGQNPATAIRTLRRHLAKDGLAATFTSAIENNIPVLYIVAATTPQRRTIEEVTALANHSDAAFKTLSREDQDRFYATLPGPPKFYRSIDSE